MPGRESCLGGASETTRRQSWCTDSFNPAFRRQRQTDNFEFQASLAYRERENPALKNKKQNQKGRTKVLEDLHSEAWALLSFPP